MKRLLTFLSILLLQIPSLNIVMAQTVPASPETTGANRVDTLQEIVVRADEIIRKGNNLTLMPTKRDKRFAAGGIDVLANMNVPEIQIDPMTNKVTTNTGEDVSMFVDYIEADDRQIRNLRPQDILRIDILYYPSDPRFRDVKVAANFIMRKYEYGGYTKLGAAQTVTAFQGNYDIYSKFSYRKMTYDLSTNLSYERLGNESREENWSEFNIEQGRLIRNSTTESSERKTLTPNVAFRAIYAAEKVNIVNSVGFNYDRTNPDNQTSNVDYTSIFNSGKSISKTKTSMRSFAWNGNYYFPLPKQSSLNFSGNFRYGRNHDFSFFELTGYEPITNYIKEDSYEANGRLSFTKTLGYNNISTSISGGWSENTLDYINQSLSAVSYSKYYGEWGISTHLDLFDRLILDPSIILAVSHEQVNGFEKTQFKPYFYMPFFVRVSNPGSFNGSLQYSRGAASANQLSPVTIRVNEIEAIRGNEKLGGWDFYQARLVYSYYHSDRFRLSADAVFGFSNHSAIPVYSETVSNEGTPLVIRDFIRNSRNSTTTLGITLTGSLFNSKLRYNLRGLGFYYAQRGYYQKNGWGGSVTFDASLYLGNFRISGYVRTTQKQFRSSYDSKSPVNYYVSGSWSWKDLFVDLRFSNPFRRSYKGLVKTFQSPVYSYVNTDFNPAYHQFLRIQVSYSFNYGKKLNKNNELKKLNDANSIILK